MIALHDQQCAAYWLPASSAVTYLQSECRYLPVTSCDVCVQADGNHVEVVATTHATTGVRHLVKSVVRGLKACQVCAHLVKLLLRQHSLQQCRSATI